MYNKVKKLRKENNELEENCNLSEQADEALTNIIAYIRGARITEYQQELVRRDITSMIIDGEKRGLSVQEIIGDNYKDFCDNVIAEIPKMTTKEYVLYNLGFVFSALGWAILAYGIYIIFSNQTPIVPVSIGWITEMALLTILAIVLVRYICKTAFDDSGSDSKIVTAIIFIAILLTLILLIVFNKPLFHIHIAILLGMGIALVVAAKVIESLS